MQIYKCEPDKVYFILQCLGPVKNFCSSFLFTDPAWGITKHTSSTVLATDRTASNTEVGTCREKNRRAWIECINGKKPKSERLKGNNNWRKTRAGRQTGDEPGSNQ